MADEFNLPKIEEKILKFWSANQIFEKSLLKNQPKSGSPLSRGRRRTSAKTFVFYEGPPYANGKPGIHHVLARVVKDVILRYKTMRGFYVPRRAGWDTHGLPVEMAAEKALGLKSKKDIEKYGVKLFNEKAKEAVWLYKDEWERMTERIGYWLDLKDAYVTCDPEYIETLWWTLAQIAKRKLLYKGYKVMPWCTRCGTALSSHELALGYKETVDQSVYVKFKLKRGQRIGDDFVVDEDTFILSWTTTPWTLPGNVALAVNKKIEYAILKKMVGGRIERLIIAKEILEKDGGQFGRAEDIREAVNGKDLIGLSYEPLFAVPELRMPASYRVYDADFVTTSDGTGVVHTAVMYGEDDYQLGKRVGLPEYHTVDEDGKFKRSVPGLAGLYVKDPETTEKILNYLKAKSYQLKAGPYTHEYPYCWRCETPILYYARTSWFIGMSRLRAKLLEQNKKINWIPEHLKNGRFGEWLREAKDWNLSRERYWGTPLPIWECNKCGAVDVVGGLDELDRKTRGARNKYWVMRHGESFSNVWRIVDSGKGHLHLTPKGKMEAEDSAKKLRRSLRQKKIDIVISSDITRTKETARIAEKILGVKKISFDKRLEEIHLGVLDGCHDRRYHEILPTYEEKFEKGPEGGESLRDLRKRVWGFLAEIEKKYKGKNILLVSHEYPIWMIFHAAHGWSEKRAIEEKIKRGHDFFTFAELETLSFKKIPRNDTGEVDLHRPFTDSISWPCVKCDGKMRRIKEVADVWFDSGAMPFAQTHFPFKENEFARTIDNKQLTIDSRSNVNCQMSNVAIKSLAYPGDFIAEGMDQTRGWFYTLLAVATALGYEAPYKNVVSLGLINDKFGQKMSKSKGNIVDPWAVIEKYGVDAVRWYFYVANPPGEAKNFDENEIAKAFRRMHLLLWNSLMFYRTYADKHGSRHGSSRKNISVNQRSNRRTSARPLDEWILARLNETILAATKSLEKYEIREAGLAIEKLVDDLSRWYIRRSRRRLQRPVSRADFEAASGTLGFVLGELAKLLAPFTPFFSELLYEQLRGHTQMSKGSMQKNKQESVHLGDWPEVGRKPEAESRKLLASMAEVRRLASIGLAKRAEAGIKVRQPLSRISVRCQVSGVRLDEELLAILADEVNVKKVIIDPKLKEEVELDMVVTPELKKEGILRDLVRAVQDLRQKAGLRPKDQIALFLQIPAGMRLIIATTGEGLIKKETNSISVDYRRTEKFDAEISTKTAEGEEMWVAVRRI